MKWILRLLCPHFSYLRERDASGRLWLVCETCNRRVVALTRPSDYPHEVTK